MRKCAHATEKYAELFFAIKQQNKRNKTISQKTPGACVLIASFLSDKKAVIVRGQNTLGALSWWAHSLIIRLPPSWTTATLFHFLSLTPLPGPKSGEVGAGFIINLLIRQHAQKTNKLDAMKRRKFHLASWIFLHLAADTLRVDICMLYVLQLQHFLSQWLWFGLSFIEGYIGHSFWEHTYNNYSCTGW